MFCSFSTTPRILRFYCKGKVIEWDQPQFEPTIKKMGREHIQGARAVILLDVFKASLLCIFIIIPLIQSTQVQTSCGYGVPFLITEEKPGSAGELNLAMKDRETLGHWVSKKIEKNKLHAYQAEWNANSLDGLTGLCAARRDAGERLWVTETMAYIRRISAQREAVLVGIGIGVLLILALQTTQIMFTKN